MLFFCACFIILFLFDCYFSFLNKIVAALVRTQYNNVVLYIYLVIAMFNVFFFYFSFYIFLMCVCFKIAAHEPIFFAIAFFSAISIHHYDCNSTVLAWCNCVCRKNIYIYIKTKSNPKR